MHKITIVIIIGITNCYKNIFVSDKYYISKMCMFNSWWTMMTLFKHTKLVLMNLKTICTAVWSFTFIGFVGQTLRLLLLWWCLSSWTWKVAVRLSMGYWICLGGTMTPWPIYRRYVRLSKKKFQNFFCFCAPPIIIDVINHFKMCFFYPLLRSSCSNRVWSFFKYLLTPYILRYLRGAQEARARSHSL